MFRKIILLKRRDPAAFWVLFAFGLWILIMTMAFALH